MLVKCVCYKRKLHKVFNILMRLQLRVGGVGGRGIKAISCRIVGTRQSTVSGIENTVI